MTTDTDLVVTFARADDARGGATCIGAGDFFPLPAPTHAYTGHERRDESWHAQAYRDAYADVLTGARCGFWPRGPGNGWDTPGNYPKFDNNQECRIFAAVGRALAMPGATDADRWRMVERVVRREAHPYAEHVAGDV